MAENTNPSGSAEDDAKGAIKKAISSVKNTIGGAVNTIKGGSLSDNADLSLSISEGLLGLREKSYSEIEFDFAKKFVGTTYKKLVKKYG